MTFKLTPKPPQEVILQPKGERDLTPLERFIERSDIKVDLAACIRNTFVGISLVILTVGFLIFPEMFSVSDGIGSLARLLVR